MMAVAIQPRGAGIEVGTREKLFESRGFSLSDLGADYDVTADGKRFLTLIPARDNTFKPITVLLNWSRPATARWIMGTERNTAGMGTTPIRIISAGCVITRCISASGRRK